MRVPFDTGHAVQKPGSVSRRAACRSVLLTAAFLACGVGALPAIAQASPDLAVTVTASPDPAVPGDTVTVKVTARNQGDTSAPGANIGVVVIGDAELVEAEQCVNFAGLLAVCSIDTLAPGAIVKRTFTLTDLGAGPLSVQASVSYQGADLRPGDNVAAALLTVEPRADLKLELETVASSYARNTVTLVATVRNTEAGPARDSRLQITLGRDLTVATAPAGCSTAPMKLTCDLGTVASRAIVTRAIKLRARKDVTVSLLGGVTWARRDLTPSDNQAQTLVTTLLPARTVSISTLVGGVPAVCVRGGRLRLRVKSSSASLMTSADVLVSGRRVRYLTGKALRRRVVLRGLPSTDFTLRVTAKMRDSGRLTGARKLRGCRNAR